MFNKTVVDFYAHKSVFITGGTGFLGKVLLEKLLYSCPNIEKVYLLTREKKGVSISQRIEDIFDDPLFQRLKDKRLQYLKKIIPIPGDINNARLGLSIENEEMLIKDVSVAIHAAATVKFNQPLKEAWRTNVEGTRMILDLTRRMKMIEAFVYVSTAYSNTVTGRKVIEEVLYPPPADVDEVSHLIKNNLSDADTVKILDERPNTYTFTKALCEHLVAKHVAFMPTIIIRPSAVSAIRNDPVKGWIDNWFGATGLLSSTGKGLNRAFYGKESNILDLIPVDYVTNLILAATAKNCRSRELKIFNCCSSSCNPVSWGTVTKYFVKETKKYRTTYWPFTNVYFFTCNSWFLYISTLLLQLTPAYFADIFRRLAGKKPMYVKLQSILIQSRGAVDYFTDHSWIIKADNTRELYSSLSSADKNLFPCDPSIIDWDEYLQIYVQGVTRFLDKKI